MAGVTTNVSAGYIELVFECIDEAQADTFITLIQDVMAASGSYEGFETTKSAANDAVDRMLTVILPRKHLRDVTVLNLFLIGIVKDQVIPAIIAAQSTTAKDIIEVPPGGGAQN